MKGRTPLIGPLAAAIVALSIVPSATAADAGVSMASGCGPLGLGAGSPIGARLTEAAGEAGSVEPYVEEAYGRALADEGAATGAVDERARATGQVQIPVYVHVIQDSETVGAVPAQQISDQIKVLNDSYGGATGREATGFSFALTDTDVTTNAAWYPTAYGSAESEAMRAALREGGSRALNLYLVDISGDTLGWSTFPSGYAGAPALDGVVVDSATVPGGARPKYDQGDTATHEVGHWLGLFHTFQGGCGPMGDLVEDTPPEFEEHYGSCEVLDTCSAPGNDPVENFMDYSDDICMDRFTVGQGNRMHDQTAQFRNVPPVAADGAVTTKGAPVATPIGATDSDGDALTYTVSDPPDHGTLSGSGAALTYTPRAGYGGADSFTVQVTDVYGAADLAVVSVGIIDRSVALETKAKRKQALAKLAITGSCGPERCDLSVEARLTAKPPRRIRGGAEKFELKPASGRAKANASDDVKLALSRSDRDRVAGLLEEGWKARAKASITAVDDSGNAVTRKAAIAIRR